MTLSQQDLDNCRVILKAFDKAIAEGPWDHSLFYKAIGKKLKALRDEFIEEFHLDDLPPDTNEVVAQENEAPAGFTDVFISLYLAEGSNLQKWQGLLATLNTISINRPVYKNERDIRAAIRSKANKLSEGYAVVRIKDEDILPYGENKEQPVDRFGSTLLVLRENAVLTHNIVKFIHISGEYKFIKNILERQANIDLLERI